MQKIIHYCWFGGNALTQEAENCLKSWTRFCPGYKVMRWDESNYDVHKIPYIHEAYMAKKYAFVSDYARFDILYKYGGLYFDTDVELIKPIEEIICKGPFMGCEAGSPLLVNPGLGLGAEPGMEVYGEILEHYRVSHFIDALGNEDETTVVQRMSQILFKHGFEGTGNIEKISGITIYPPEYFCPLNYWNGLLTVTEKTISIHHYSASWMTKREKMIHNEIVALSRKISYKWARRAVIFKYIYKEQGILGVVKKIIKKITRRTI